MRWLRPDRGRERWPAISEFFVVVVAPPAPPTITVDMWGNRMMGLKPRAVVRREFGAVLELDNAQRPERLHPDALNPMM